MTSFRVNQFSLIHYLHSLSTERWQREEDSGPTVWIIIIVIGVVPTTGIVPTRNRPGLPGLQQIKFHNEYFKGE